MRILRGVTSSGGTRQRFERTLGSCMIAMALIWASGLGVATAASGDLAGLVLQSGGVTIGDNTNSNSQGNGSSQSNEQSVEMGGGSNTNEQGQSNDQTNENTPGQNIGVDGSGSGGDGSEEIESDEQAALASSVSDTMIATILGILLALLAEG